MYFCFLRVLVGTSDLDVSSQEVEESFLSTLPLLFVAFVALRAIKIFTTPSAHPTFKVALLPRIADEDSDHSVVAISQLSTIFADHPLIAAHLVRTADQKREAISITVALNTLWPVWARKEHWLSRFPLRGGIGCVLLRLRFRRSVFQIHCHLRLHVRGAKAIGDRNEAQPHEALQHHPDNGPRSCCCKATTNKDGNARQ
mmetsp:Transcript_38963/g.58798  ORF Transcript_38963/g.58798 Transcript_38963/m.58798 type:complete len:200 (+) Transcript_38963:378-977(+)